MRRIWLLWAMLLVGCAGSHTGSTAIPTPTTNVAATASRAAELTPRSFTPIATEISVSRSTLVATRIPAPPPATPTSLPPTATPVPTTAPATVRPPPPPPVRPTPAISGIMVRSQYETIDPRELQRNPAAFTGRKVRVEGVVAALSDNGAETVLRLDGLVLGSAPAVTVPIHVAVAAPLPEIRVGDRVAVYGVIDRGADRFIAAFGSAAARPLLVIDYLDRF